MTDELIDQIFSFVDSEKGKCAKQVVEAVIITKSGSIHGGSNWCATPQQVCPRDTAGYKSGEGYHLCETVCNQQHHAEVDACLNAEDTEGATLFMRGHTYCCDNCKTVMEKFGITNVVIL